jgi:hypothetical protein
MKMYGWVHVQIHVILTSALFGGEWSALRPGIFTLGERIPSTHWIGGWVGPRSRLDDMQKNLSLPGLELRPFGRPAHSQSLYRHATETSFRKLNKMVCSVHVISIFHGRNYKRHAIIHALKLNYKKWNIGNLRKHAIFRGSCDLLKSIMNITDNTSLAISN